MVAQKDFFCRIGMPQTVFKAGCITFQTDSLLSVTDIAFGSLLPFQMTAQGFVSPVVPQDSRHSFSTVLLKE